METGSGFEALGIIPNLDPDHAVLRCRSCGTLLLFSDQEIHEEFHTFIDNLRSKR
jgi:hypothetical protein